MRVIRQLLDKGFNKQFLLLHAEKPIVWTVCAFVALLVYRGATRETLDRQRSPGALEQLSELAREHVNDSAWDPRHVELANVNFVGEAKKSLVLVEPGAYRVPNNWGNSRGGARRQDPEIYPAIELQGLPGYGVFAFVDPNYEEQTMAMDKTEAGARVIPTDPTTGEPISSRNVRRGTSRAGGARTGYGAAGSYARSGRTGDGLTSASEGYSVADDVAMTAPVGSKLVKRNFVSLVGLVPLKQQRQEYERALGASFSYDPSSDYPDYRMYLVERVEVTHESPGTPIDWSESNPNYREFLIGPKTVAKQLAQWNSEPLELVDSSYLQPGLVFPLAPMLQKTWKPWATHAKLPLISSQFEAPAAPESVPEAPETSVDDLESLDVDPAEAAFALNPYSAAGSPALGGGYGRPYGHRGGARYRGSPYGPSRPGGYGAYGGFGENAGEQEYALFRHVDFGVEVGKQYRYRVRLVARDPNHGRAPAELVRPRRSDDNKRYALSAFSEPTAVVTIPPQGNLLAGGVTQRAGEPKARIMALSLVPSLLAEAAKEVLVSRGDLVNFRQTVRVIRPLVPTVGLADRDQEAPTTATVSRHYFRSDQLVVDIRGGKPFTDSKGRRTELTEPGALLLMGPGGQLYVRRELDDFEDYRGYQARIREIEDTARLELDKSRDG